MSLIARLQENIVSKGLGGVETAPPEDDLCEVVTIGLEQVVTTEKQYYPLTGIFANVEGWKWNKSIPQKLSEIRERIETSIGGYSENLEEGSIKTDWFGGVLSGISLNAIKEFQDITKRVGWRPVLEKGVYSIFHKEKRLPSKASISKIFDAALVLPDEILENSIEIILFKRDANFNNVPYIKYNYKDTLTDTYSFRINEENQIEASIFLEKKIGTNDLELAAIKCHSEYKRFGRPERSTVYTNYFPFKNMSVLTVENDTVNEWTVVSSFKNSEETDRHVMLEPEKGSVIFPSFVREQKLYVKEDSGTYIEFFNNLKDVKVEGILLNNNTEIPYYDKGSYKLYCSSNRVASLSRGDVLNIKQQGKHLTSVEEIYLNYTAVPRIEYEVIEEHFEDKQINLKPYKKISSNGILEIGVEERNVFKINLSCDKPQIIDNIFGELFIQADASKITAEVLNANNKPVSEISVTFEAEDGNFEGLRPSITKVSNLLGIATTSYQYDYSDESLQRFRNPHHIFNSSYFQVNDIPPGVLAEDITIFQCLKTDPFYGTIGNEYDVTSTNTKGNYLVLNLGEEVQDYEEYKTMYTTEFALDDGSGLKSRDKIDEELCLSAYYNYGLAVVSYSNTIQRSGIIREIGSNYVVIEGPEDFLLPDKVYLFKRSALKFSDSGRTHDRILYSYNAQEEIYKPIKATRIVGERIYLDNVLLPVGSLTDDNKIIAGYKLFFPELVTLQATAIDPATGSLIRSNLIKLKINFPGYLRGENGFRFIDSENDEESALGGTNFLTINPEIPNVLNIIVE